MKLWKSKKTNNNNNASSSSGGSTSTISCVPGKSSSLNKTIDAKTDTATTSSTTLSGKESRFRKKKCFFFSFTNILLFTTIKSISCLYHKQKRRMGSRRFYVRENISSSLFVCSSFLCKPRDTHSQSVVIVYFLQVKCRINEPSRPLRESVIDINSIFQLMWEHILIEWPWLQPFSAQLVLILLHLDISKTVEK